MVLEQGLVGNDGERCGRAEVVGDQLAVCAKVVAEPFGPLRPDGEARGEDQGLFPEPPDDLQPQYRFPRTGWGDDVDAAVFAVAVQVGEHAGLVGAPGVLEF